MEPVECLVDLPGRLLRPGQTGQRGQKLLRLQQYIIRVHVFASRQKNNPPGCIERAASDGQTFPDGLLVLVYPVNAWANLEALSDVVNNNLETFMLDLLLLAHPQLIPFALALLAFQLVAGIRFIRWAYRTD